MSSSESAFWRKKGGKLHSDARLVDGSGRDDLLEGAIRCYEKAIRQAASASEEASAHKNCAKALTELHQTRHREGEESFADNIRILHEWSITLEFGLRASLSEVWLKDVQEQYTRRLQVSLQLCEKFDFVIGVSQLDKILRVLVDGCFRFKCLTEICRSYLTKAITWLEEKNYGGVLACTQEGATYLAEADAAAATSSERQIVRQFKRCNDMIRIQASAMQTIRKADSVFQAMMETKQINEDVLYEVIDWYTRAVQMTEDNGLDSQMAYLKLADVYEGVLQNKDRAASYHEKANMPRDGLRVDLISLVKGLPQPSWHEEDLPVSRYATRFSKENGGEQYINHSEKSDQKIAKGQDNLQDGQMQNKTKPAGNGSRKGNIQEEMKMISNKQDTGSDRQEKEGNKQDEGEGLRQDKQSKQQDKESHQKDKEEDRQDKESHQQDTKSHQKDNVEDRQDKESDQQDKESHQKDKEKDRQDKEGDQQDTKSHQKDKEEDSQDKESDQQDKESHQKDKERHGPHRVDRKDQKLPIEERAGSRKHTKLSRFFCMCGTKD